MLKYAGDPQIPKSPVNPGKMVWRDGSEQVFQERAVIG